MYIFLRYFQGKLVYITFYVRQCKLSYAFTLEGIAAASRGTLTDNSFRLPTKTSFL